MWNNVLNVDIKDLRDRATAIVDDAVLTMVKHAARLEGTEPQEWLARNYTDIMNKRKEHRKVADRKAFEIFDRWMDKL